MLFAVQTKQTSLPRVDGLWQSVPFMFTPAALNYKAAWPYHQIKKNLLLPGWTSWEQAETYPLSRAPKAITSLPAWVLFSSCPDRQDTFEPNPHLDTYMFSLPHSCSGFIFRHCNKSQTMDREAWHAAIQGSQRVRHDWATELTWLLHEYYLSMGL